MATMTAARLTVSRDASDDVGDRQIVLSLDSEHWTTLLFGQAATRELPPGSHRLKADNTLFWKTVPFDVGPGEEVRFVVANRKGPGSGILLLVGAPLYYLRVSRG
jgi:hypothetical protein